MAAGDPTSGSGAVAWDEARELLVVVLVAAAVMKLLGPIAAWIQVDGDHFDRGVLTSALTGVNGGTGLTLIGAAVLLCTTPVVDVVPGLRLSVVVVATTATVMGSALIGLTLTNDSAMSGADLVWDKLRTILSFSAPGTLLAGTSAWMARKVVPFPGD